MELTRARDQFPTVMERVEVMSDMKQERDGHQGASPPGNFFAHTL